MRGKRRTVIPGNLCWEWGHPVFGSAGEEEGELIGWAILKGKSEPLAKEGYRTSINGERDKEGL